MDARNCQVVWKSHSSEMTNIILKYRDETKYTDATIICSGYTYPVHKVILSSSSKYFEELLQQTENLHPLSHPVLVLNNVKKGGLEAILNFIYLGEVSVQEKDIAQLFDSARELKIKGLCEEALRSVCLSIDGQTNVTYSLSTNSASRKESTLESESADPEKKRKRDTLTGSSVKLRRNPKRHKKTKGNDSCSNSAKGSMAKDVTTTDFAFTAGEAATEDNVGSGISDGGMLTQETETKNNAGEAEEEAKGIADSEEDFVNIKEEFIEDTCSSNTETIFLPFKDEPEEISSANNEIDSLGDQEILDRYMMSGNPTDNRDGNVALEFERSGTHDNVDPGCSSSTSVEDPDDDNSPIPEKHLPDFLKSFKVYRFSPYLQGRLKESYWEQKGIVRLMKGIKNQEITLKEAATLLGTTYNILYRHYSIIYGGIKQLSEEVKETNVNPRKFVVVKLLECPHCNYKTPYNQNILEHLWTHSSVSSSGHKKTPKGGKSSKGDSTREESLFTCDICSAKFAHMRTLRSHKQCHIEASV
ncbi:zinc finger and BTB domain-containing protein 46-like isoform X2 [Palaemon carinicauda]|uniref:zinc finger and BTB domain-containing protein 46-like isoform X2 n=1 Tax=Palaemon carinicauda TaxID=392227 RepID=UPI0035B58BD1